MICVFSESRKRNSGWLRAMMLSRQGLPQTHSPSSLISGGRQCYQGFISTFYSGIGVTPQDSVETQSPLKVGRRPVLCPDKTSMRIERPLKGSVTNFNKSEKDREKLGCNKSDATQSLRSEKTTNIIDGKQEGFF